MDASVSLYRTVSPTVLKTHEKILGQASVGLEPGEFPNYVLRVDDYGHFLYNNSQKISALIPVQPTSLLEGKARSVAESFFGRVNSTLANSRLADLPYLFPQNKRLKTISLFRTELGILYLVLSYEITLSGGQSNSDFEVQGARIDVSVGSDLEIVGFQCIWRPIVSSIRENLLPVLFDSISSFPIDRGKGNEIYIEVNGRTKAVKSRLFYLYNPNQMQIYPFYGIEDIGIPSHHEIPACNKSFFA